MSPEEDNRREDVQHPRYLKVLSKFSTALVALATTVAMVAGGAAFQRISFPLLVIPQGLLAILTIGVMETIAATAVFIYVSQSVKEREHTIRSIRSKEKPLFQAIETELAQLMEKG